MIIINLLIFLLFYFIFFLSTVGYGLLVNNFIKLNFEIKNYFFYSFLGIIFLTFLSYFTIFFISHNEIFNSFLHLFGLSIFLFYRKEIKIDKKSLIIFLVIFCGLIISKTHDDFSYYHLPQILNFSTNKLQIGLANLDLTYAHHSSIFFLSSLFYIPIFKYYFVHIPNFLIFSNILILFFNLLKNSKFSNLTNIFILYSISFILLKFTRVSEFGSDIPGQIAILFLVYLILETIIDNSSLKKNFLFSLLILVFCITLKTYFIVYSLFIFYFLYKIKIFKLLSLLKEKKIFFIYIFLILFFFFIINLLTSGCLIYPMNNFCFENLYWGMPNNEVKDYKLWYEIWSKSLAGAGYQLENKEYLVKNFLWIPHWYKNYFIGKVTDLLLLLSLLSSIFLFLFSFKKKIIKNKKKLKFSKLLIIAYFLIFIIWLYKHPQLRYGGYAPLFIMFAVPISIYLSKFNFTFKEFKKKFSILVFICLTFFVTKNINRINLEFERNDLYKFTNFPFFSVPEFEYKKKEIIKNVYIYRPVEDISCWDTPSPCGFEENLKANKKFGRIIFFRNK